jgi:hypothetical protein
MSTVTRTIIEAETVSAREAMRTAMREEALRAAARQADSRREPIHQKPVPAGHPDPRSAGARPGRPDPVGAPTGNNSLGQPEVRVVGRSRPAKPIRSAKSVIVPEPDQIISRRPDPRPVTGPLEPRGWCAWTPAPKGFGKLDRDVDSITFFTSVTTLVE